MFLSRINIFGTLLGLSLLTLIAASPDAHAQPSGARGDDFIYRVMQNDTLIDLSSRFTGTPDNWSALQTLNAVADPFALRIGRELRIPFALIPEVAANAEMIHIVGEALINKSAARLSDMLSEGDVLETRTHSFATFRLPDGSISALPPETTIRFKRLRTFLGTGLTDTILQLDHGDLESAVAPDGQGTGRYEVRTPVSITGVRGTRLRVRTDGDSSLSEVLSGTAQLGTRQTDGPRLGTRQGTAVMQDGTILPSRALLAAPTLTRDTENPYSRTIMFEPVAGAVAYVVRVASDESGTQPVWTDTITGPPQHYRTPGSGQWYVLVRAIDDVGLMSDDAIIQVEGQQVLISSYGLAVNTRYGEPVMLTDY